MTEEEMVASVEPYIELIARRHRFHLHPGGSVDHDDLVAAGRMAALHAARRFDPGRGFKFLTYASRWIEQSIRREAEDCHAVYIPERRQRDGSEARHYISFDKELRYGGTLHDLIGEDSTEQRLDERRAVAEMQCLPEDEQSVLFDFFWEDLRLFEIAKKMRTYPEQVRRIRERALGQLRKQLAA